MTARSCSSADPPTNPLFGAFFEAVQQAGYPLTDDVNGYRQEGFARFDRNVYRGRRLSAARAYLHPVRSRKNLTVETLAFATKVRFQGTRAVGVDYLRGGRLHRSVDAGQVILSGGAINTPQLLQLSGVGDEALLRQHGVGVVHHLPGVGENLQDHLEVYIQYASKQPVSIAPGLRWRARPGHRLPVAGAPPRPRRHEPLRGRRLLPQQRGRRLPEPDVPLPPGRDPLRRDLAHRGPRLPGAHRPDVRRHPRLGADPLDRPEGRTRPCSSTTCPPRPTGGSGSRRSGSPATSSTSRRSRPTTTASSRPAARSRPTRRSCDWVREDAETALHPSCTAKMGVDEMAVVDPSTMGVHGVEGLRVVDASVFPFVTNGNIYAPGDDGRREGRRPDRRQHPAAGRRRAVLPLPRRHPPLPARRQPQPRRIPT